MNTRQNTKQNTKPNTKGKKKDFNFMSDIDYMEDMKMFDYYAGQALNGLLAQIHFKDLENYCDQNELVDLAWTLADNMMKVKHENI